MRYISFLVILVFLAPMIQARNTNVFVPKQAANDFGNPLVDKCVPSRDIRHCRPPSSYPSTTVAAKTTAAATHKDNSQIGN
ncbi:hypothetical protein RND81_05G270600 [Saponaria officinalis]|uniref:Uncharacterized protein n=1 Tax=Saponaria officinalis TaxID=3572 RepID=A0AAW1L2T6_SAPOF